MAEPEIRYCTTRDGVSIAYMLEGQGLALLLLPALVESFTVRHISPTVAYWHDRLASSLTLVRYDVRGTGISQREVSDFSGDAMVADIEAVADAARLTKMALCASTIGGARAIRFAARHPDLVSHLILIDALAATEDANITRQAADALSQLAQTNWHLAAQTLADMGGRSLVSAELRQRLGESALLSGEMIERSITGDTYAAMIGAAWESWDATADLANVVAPTLVIHHEENFMFPLAAARRITAGIRDAKLMTLKGMVVGATSDPDQIDDIVAAIHEFVGVGGQTGLRPTSESKSAVILFTDIVDSTAVTERLGDARFRELSRALDAGLRGAIRDAGGVAVEGKLLGDGVLATFGSAAQAIDGARQCLALSAASELGLHIGLHAGDVIREEVDGRRDVFGGAVNIAARICGLSAPGEILVSDVVRGMARTSVNGTFEDRGEHALKGIADAQRVYAVRPAP